mmetsp:Transcript_9409/g.25225  ORF Transcript_9409/g.25225 Transcript_9409/m.25225 type:complete len:117 (-) Transcript_9409:22-372(-)
MLVPCSQSAIMMMLYTVRYCHWKARKAPSFSPLGRALDSVPSALSEFLVANATHPVTHAITAKVWMAQAGQSGSASMPEALAMGRMTMSIEEGLAMEERMGKIALALHGSQRTCHP